MQWWRSGLLFLFVLSSCGRCLVMLLNVGHRLNLQGFPLPSDSLTQINKLFCVVTTEEVMKTKAIETVLKAQMKTTSVLQVKFIVHTGY